MSTAMDAPKDLKYTKEHEWVRILGDSAEIGITAFAADQLGDVVFVELPELGVQVRASQPFGVVESVKSVSDLFAPITGTVAEINSILQSAPEKVNEDPYGEGWMIRLTLAAPIPNDLLSAEEYTALLESSGV